MHWPGETTGSDMETHAVLDSVAKSVAGKNVFAPAMAKNFSSG